MGFISDTNAVTHWIMVKHCSFANTMAARILNAKRSNDLRENLNRIESCSWTTARKGKFFPVGDFAPSARGARGTRNMGKIGYKKRNPPVPDRIRTSMRIIG